MIQVIGPAPSLAGTVVVPGDKSISHRYALLGALARGPSELHNFSASQDCHSTLDCLRALGVSIRDHNGRVTIDGKGLASLRPASAPLDAGNSGTTMRLLSGMLAGYSFESTLTGDGSLLRRPMGRILDPLRMMGAQVRAREGDLPPFTLRGGKLKHLRYSLPVASAQVKSCILLAGLFADGPTAVEENIPTRDHTEVALRLFGANVRSRGAWIEMEPEPTLSGQHLSIPGDLSSAAFFLVAAALVPDTELRLPAVGLNPRRRELLDYLASAGADITIENEAISGGEPRGDLRVRHSRALLELGLAPIRGGLVAALIDEIPVLAVLGSQTAGGLEIADARELRVKESDRIAALAHNLRAMGASVEERPDGLRIAGRCRLRGAEIETRGDHRIAMAFSTAALIAQGATRIHDAECADVSFPGFYQALQSLRPD